MFKKIISVMSVALMVFLCSFGVFANSNAESYSVSTINQLTSDSKVRYQIQVSNLWANRDDSMYTSSGTYISYDNVIYINIILTNQSATQDVYCNNLWGFNLYLDCKQTLGTQSGETYYTPYKIVDIEPLSDYNFVVASIIGSDSYSYSINFFPNPQYTNPDVGSRVTIPAGSSLVAQFKVTVDGFNATGVTVGNTGQYITPTVNGTSLSTSTWTNGTFPIKAPYESLYSMNMKLDDLLSGYTSNQQHSNEVNTQADSNTSIMDSQHTQEQSYFTDTNTAINSTGINNFTFSPSISSGLGGIKNDFTSVWNSLGTFNTYFITSLTIGLALSIIRHRRMFTKS